MIFDAIIRNRKNTTHPVQTCLPVNAGLLKRIHGSKDLNTRLGTRHFTVVLLGTRNSAENWHSAHPYFCYDSSVILTRTICDTHNYILSLGQL